MQFIALFLATQLAGVARASGSCVAPDLQALNVEQTSRGTLTISTFDVTLRCKRGFQGSLSAVPCTQDQNPYTVSGTCDAISGSCVAPDLQALNVEQTSEGTLTISTFDVTLRCKRGFQGSPSAVSCIQNQNAYTVSGTCNAIPGSCVAPDLQALNVEQTSEGTLTISTFDVTLRCKRGFQGSLSAVPCTQDQNPYTVSGTCDAISGSCIAPDLQDLQALNVEQTSGGTLTISTFGVTLRCKRGFQGSPSAVPCTQDQNPYTVSGTCNAIPATKQDTTTTTRRTTSSSTRVASATPAVVALFAMTTYHLM